MMGSCGVVGKLLSSSGKVGKPSTADKENEILQSSHEASTMNNAQSNPRLIGDQGQGQ